MKTATLDQTEIIEALDWEPQCEALEGCSRAANIVLILVCGCSQLMCQPHRNRDYRNFNAGLFRHQDGTCKGCGKKFGPLVNWEALVAREVPL